MQVSSVTEVGTSIYIKTNDMFLKKCTGIISVMSKEKSPYAESIFTNDDERNFLLFNIILYIFRSVHTIYFNYTSQLVIWC